MNPQVDDLIQKAELAIQRAADALIGERDKGDVEAESAQRRINNLLHGLHWVEKGRNR